MSSRAFKRAANKEDSLSLKHVNDDYEETIDDSDQERPKKNLFDLLNEGNDDDNVDQNSENEKISEKPSSKDSSSTVSVLSSSSKKKKKQKSVSTKIMTKDSDKKTKLGKKVEEMNDLELESLIREVSE
ncbi:13688_t:CDS:2, partial [Gigaspora rosea]